MKNISSLVILFLFLGCNIGVIENGQIPIKIEGADGAFDDRQVYFKVHDVHPNGQTKELRISFDDTTIVKYNDSTGFQYSSEVHVKNRLLKATFFNPDQSIAEEQNYIWNDSIEDLHWTIFHFGDTVRIEGLTGHENYLGEWSIKYKNDTSEIMNYGYSGDSNEIPDSMGVFYKDKFVGYRKKNKAGKHVFYELITNANTK
ncbi:MAG: hypothetical protein R3279_13720 [Putridiphycobacter sp.]|nr:hypothetical protein [Putridiphycobacter sp.]